MLNRNIALVLAAALALGACNTGNPRQDRIGNGALIGGAVGAATGALVSHDALGGAVVGGAIGAVAGGAIAAATADNPYHRGHRCWWVDRRGVEHPVRCRQVYQDDWYR